MSVELFYEGPISGIRDYGGPFRWKKDSIFLNGIFVQYTLRGAYELEDNEENAEKLRLSPYEIEGFLMGEAKTDVRNPFYSRVHLDRGDFASWYGEERWAGFSAAYTLQQAACFTYTSEVKPPEDEEEPEEEPEEEEEDWRSPTRWVYGGLSPQRSYTRIIKEVPEEGDPVYGTFGAKALSLQFFYGEYDFGDFVPANPPSEIWVHDRDHIVFDHFDLLKKHNETRGGDFGLVRVSQLDVAAQRHAEWLIQNTLFQHDGSAGNTPMDRAAAAGYIGAVGENLAGNVWSVEDAVNAWISSPGHFANLMNPNWAHFGCGYASGNVFGNVWVVLFGSPSEGFQASVIPYDEENDEERERQILPYRVSTSLPMVSKPDVTVSDSIPVRIGHKGMAVIVNLPLSWPAKEVTASIMDVSADGQKILISTHGYIASWARYGRPFRELLGVYEFDFKNDQYSSIRQYDDLYEFDEDYWRPSRRYVYFPEITAGDLFKPENEIHQAYYHYCLHRNPNPDEPVEGVPNEFVMVFGWQDRLLSQSEKYVTPICGQGVTQPPVNWPIVQSFTSVHRTVNDNKPDSFYEVEFDFVMADRVQIPDDNFQPSATWIRDNYPERTMAIVVHERLPPKETSYTCKQILSAHYDEHDEIVFSILDAEYSENLPLIEYPQSILSGKLTLGVAPTNYSTGDAWDYPNEQFITLGDWAGRSVYYIKESSVQLRRDPPFPATWTEGGKVRLYHAKGFEDEPIAPEDEDPKDYILESEISTQSGSSVTQVIHALNLYTGGGLTGRVGHRLSQQYYSVGSPAKFYDNVGEHTVNYSAYMEITEGCLPKFTEEGGQGYGVAKTGDEWTPEQTDVESFVDIWSAISYALRNPSTNPQWNLLEGRVFKEFFVEPWLSPAYGGYHNLVLNHWGNYDTGVSIRPMYYKDDPASMPVFDVFYDSYDNRGVHFSTYVGYPEHEMDYDKSSRYVSPVLAPHGIIGAPLYEDAAPDLLHHGDDVTRPEGMRQPWQALQCGSYNPVLKKLIRGITAPIVWTGRYHEWPEDWPEVVSGDAELFVNMGIPNWGSEEAE